MNDTTAPPYQHSTDEAIAIVGVGLLGGSIAAAVRQRGLGRSVIGVGRDRTRMDAARQAGLIDVGVTNLAEAAAVSRLIVFCTPVERIVDGVREAAVHCRPGTLLTDVGSVKGVICRELADGLPPGVTFIGSHPLAGSEKQGFEYADADLFERRVCVVTPHAETSADSLRRLVAFWSALGLTVVPMSADVHDTALAQTSHVPHVAAAALAAALADSNRPLAATGFRDTTRIAAGDPDLWVGILLNNADEVVGGLDRFAGMLQEYRRAIAARDAPALRQLLQRAKANRDALDSDPNHAL
jgi:cyclohexadieny/prephenate dehydrogenase